MESIVQEETYADGLWWSVYTDGLYIDSFRDKADAEQFVCYIIRHSKDGTIF